MKFEYLLKNKKSALLLSRQDMKMKLSLDVSVCVIPWYFWYICKYVFKFYALSISFQGKIEMEWVWYNHSSGDLPLLKDV